MVTTMKVEEARSGLMLTLPDAVVDSLQNDAEVGTEEEFEGPGGGIG